MANIHRARVIAPIAHLVVFALTWVLVWLQRQPLLDGPAGFPFAIVFFADFPISAIAFGVMFTSEANTPYAVALWGLIGTFWWYFLGNLIDRRRGIVR